MYYCCSTYEYNNLSIRTFNNYKNTFKDFKFKNVKCTAVEYYKSSYICFGLSNGCVLLFNKIKECSISMIDYSEDKLPKCEKCLKSTYWHYSGFSHGTFGDGYKG